MPSPCAQVAGSKPQHGFRDWARNAEIAGQARNDGYRACLMPVRN